MFIGSYTMLPCPSEGSNGYSHGGKWLKFPIKRKLNTFFNYSKYLFWDYYHFIEFFRFKIIKGCATM